MLHLNHCSDLAYVIRNEIEKVGISLGFRMTSTKAFSGMGINLARA
jgi:hypothetical protein